MARIVFADDGITFDGETPTQRPLGGVESSVVLLAQTMAARGHEVLVANKCERERHIDGVHWRPIDQGIPETADLYIANRGHRLLDACKGAAATVFWTHNPCRYMLKFRYLHRLWRRRPVVVFIGDYHATTLPTWVPDGGRRTIPYGVPDLFCTDAVAVEPPGPRAIFTSNPLRGLNWLLDLWAKEIEPKVPGAELHVFSGAATYGEAGARKNDAMGQVLGRAEKMADNGVRLRAPVDKNSLIDELRLSRAMLYPGDLNETYCLAVAEAQAMGVPAVVNAVGSMPERVQNGVTGTVANDEMTFAKAAVELLSDDKRWRSQHEAAIDLQRAWRWPDAAGAFEQMIGRT